MPFTAASHDLESRTITITADFTAPVERVWQVSSDPRQLERIWGPPGFPATFDRHELKPGGRMHYYMTGPDGEKFYPTTEGLQQVLDMGVIEGASSAINQVDSLLAEG